MAAVGSIGVPVVEIGYCHAVAHEPLEAVVAEIVAEQIEIFGAQPVDHYA